MPRFLAVALAALACAFTYLVATGIAMPEAASTRAMFVVASVALLVSAAAMVLALAATIRLRAQRIEVQNLARSVDAAFADFTAGRKRGDHTPEPVTESTIAEEKAVLHPDDTDRRPIEIAAASHPASPRIEPQRTVPAKRTGLNATADAPAFRLNPLLSVATGAIAGYDVLVGAPANGATGKHGKSAPPNGAAGAAAVECALVLAAIDASSQPGFAGDRTPLHISVSQALLADREQFATVIEALRRLNGTARSIVLTLPTALMEQPGQHSAALAKLAATRSRLAAEGWPSSEAGVEALWRSGVSFLRLPATRLLAREAGQGTLGTVSLVQILAASGMAAIATDVATDAEAGELARLGIALVADTTVPDPARPRSGNGASTGDAAHI